MNSIFFHILILGSLIGLHVFTWRYDRKGGSGAQNLFYSFVAALGWMLFFTFQFPAWLAATAAVNELSRHFPTMFYLIGFVQAGIVWPVFILIENEDTRLDASHQVLPGFLGVLALVTGGAMAIFIFLALALSGMGDGAGPYSPTRIQSGLVFLPALGLLLIAFSCLRFVRGLPLLIIGIAVHLILGGMIILLIVGRGWWLVFPASFFLVAWQALYRQRRKHNPTATTSALDKLLLPSKPNTKPW